MSVRSKLLRSFSLLILGASSACVSVRPPGFLEIPAIKDWGETLKQAQSLAVDGRTWQADSLLAAYAAQYPDVPQAREAGYWRALLNLRSMPSTQRLSFALPLLQAYVAAGPTTEHWMEADALLHAASRVDTLSRIAETYVSKGEVTADAANARVADAKAETKAATADTKAQDDEIRRLKDELAKSKDELDRIKKRLAEPPKKPPM